MSSSFLQLALESSDLSQALWKADQIHSKWSWVKKVVILSENSCHFVNLLIFAELFLYQLEINHVIQQLTEENLRTL
jgi:hypothetical protein